MSGCSKICSIIKLRLLLRRWRKNTSRSSRRIPCDVPPGHIAVYVGLNHRRFVVHLAHLNHPVFKKLLAQAEEEYGFTTSGPLHIPCDELIFQDFLRCLCGRSDYKASGVCLRTKLISHDAWAESQPLLNSLR
ncbi:hypothetical protein DCAR_0520041 [Daucus carota subsp. sativus]|uniref:Uncharacterized protein n=1 Tax=Daucus carota subsp. sativus TaxID=79200 RepID=A0A164YB97_DAUCS|nr:hypothetical protein DCAR_0520041 [Daucus carota subsp. sativus]